MRILVAEDDPISRRLLKTSLEKWEFNVIPAEDGNEAWKIMSGENPPQMAVLDWMMPGMDGVTVCRKIRSELPLTIICYIILLTSKGRREDVISGFDAGADDYITKPFNAQELKARIHVGTRILSLQNTLSAHIEKLKELDLLKSEFLATVSHELRTPIAVMREGVSLCVDGVAGKLNEMQHEFLSDTLENIDRLSLLIDDLLDISKIEAGKVLIRKSSINICDVAGKTVKSFQMRAKNKGVNLHLSIPEHPLKVYADGDRVFQIFSNLITNALNFTPEGGSISVSVKGDNDMVICSIQDTGIGIDKENIPKLFHKFQQFGRQEGPGYKGTGLGLAIVKGLVEKHGGKIRAESQKGKGSTFTFTLQKNDVQNIILLSQNPDADKFIRELLKQNRINILSAESCEKAADIVKLKNTEAIIYNLNDEADSNMLNKFLSWPEFKDIPSLIIGDRSFDDEELLNIVQERQIRLMSKPVDKDKFIDFLSKSIAVGGQ